MFSEHGGLQTGLEQGKEEDNKMHFYSSEGPPRYFHFRTSNKGEVTHYVQT